MAEGDTILIQTIKNLGSSNEDVEDFHRLADFTTNYVLESAARCLNVIFQDDDEKPFQNVKPPPSMSARYKMGSKLAELCQKLGFKGQDVGYQTFLYSNESDLRVVFMFLIDKLPKDQDQTSKELDPKSLKKEEIRSSINTSKPPKTEEIEDSQSFSVWDVEFTDEQMFRLLPKETRAAAIDAKITFNSLIQKNEELKLSQADVFPAASKACTEVWSAETETSAENVVQDRFHEVDSGPVEIKNRSQVISENHSEVESEDQSDAAKLPQKPSLPSQDQKWEALKAKRLKVEQELQDKQAEYTANVVDFKAKQNELTQTESKVTQLQRVKEIKVIHWEKKKQILTLLSSYQENEQKLKGIYAKKKVKMVAMKDQWTEHKKALLEDEEQLRIQIEALKATKTKQTGTVSLRDQITTVEQELKQQDILAKKYAKQIENTPTGQSRSSYTKQILDILTNVSRQKAETNKVIEDIRSTQKDINLLEGKLSRTYADTDYLLFEQAKKDKNLVPAYRLLTEIHMASDEIIELVRKTGQVKRATRSAHDQATAERAKQVEDKVTKLKADLEQIRAENKLMKNQL